jgi:hypothetical protein
MTTFTHAGVSTLEGVTKVRFANDALRVKVLAKNGHKDIDMVEFLTPLTKEAAVAKLIEMNFAKGNASIQAALDEALEKRTATPKVAKAPKAKTAPKVKAKVKPTMEAIKAKVAAKTPSKAAITAQMEDAPY